LQNVLRFICHEHRSKGTTDFVPADLLAAFDNEVTEDLIVYLFNALISEGTVIDYSTKGDCQISIYPGVTCGAYEAGGPSLKETPSTHIIDQSTHNVQENYGNVKGDMIQ